MLGTGKLPDLFAYSIELRHTLGPHTAMTYECCDVRPSSAILQSRQTAIHRQVQNALQRYINTLRVRSQCATEGQRR